MTTMSARTAASPRNRKQGPLPHPYTPPGGES